MLVFNDTISCWENNQGDTIAFVLEDRYTGKRELHIRSDELKPTEKEHEQMKNHCSFKRN